MDSSDFLALVNALLNWEEGAHELLGDYLEEAGYERKFHEQGGLYHQVGVVLALVNIGALRPEQIPLLQISESQRQAAAEAVAQRTQSAEPKT